MVDISTYLEENLNYALNMSFTILLIIGIVANISVLYALNLVVIRSCLTTWLLRAQVVLDAFCCFWIMLFTWVRYYPYSDPLSGWIQCHIWRTQIPYWLVAFMSTCNLTWIMLDRLWATVYCATYRRYEKAYIIWTTIGTVMLSVGTLIPNMLIVEFHNMTCSTKITPNHTFAFRVTMFYQPFNFVVYYLLPISVMLVAYFWVVCNFQLMERNWQNAERHGQSTSWSLQQSDQGQSESNGTFCSIDPLYRSMTVGSLCMISIVILGHTFDTVNYLLSNLVSEYSYDFGSDVQLIGAFVNTVNSIFNPVIIALSVPSIKKLPPEYLTLIIKKSKRVCIKSRFEES
ncbi:hypothetical protein D915_001272 [Fasciola hepatica]|uniref:7 transmembrane receptor n=1 Tax=Fasciola hepatica TaxID=6192 RepID=A0A4E0RIM3_FASHE|nr:hypothetical protein D915_001272 [Fasciola hepatica]